MMDTGDTVDTETEFGARLQEHRRELHVHCYRMLGSFADAEDLVQETFLRAWNKRDTFDGEQFRAWLYKIATNACLDAIRKRDRQVPALTSLAEVPWPQRARATLRENLPERHDEWTTPDPTTEERELVARYIDAHQRGDWQASVAMMREDIRITMPPHPERFDGIPALAPLFERAFGTGCPGEWRLVATRANRMPTAATYLRAHGDTEFRAFMFDVFRIVAGKFAEITTFDATLFPAFGLPPAL